MMQKLQDASQRYLEENQDSPMVKHLKLHHPKKHLELIKKKDDKDRVVAEKRKASEAD